MSKDKKAFDFSQVKDPVARKTLEELTENFGLQHPIKKADFVNPDDDHIAAAERLMVAFASGGQLTVLDVMQVVERVVWMSGEIGSLKRTNRNIRSKNLRLKRGKDISPTAAHLQSPGGLYQALAATKHQEHEPIKVPEDHPLLGGGQP